MPAYNPEKFASLAATELGRRIWSFLNTDDIVARLETASQLGKPALEGIEDQILLEFGCDVMADRVKQMIGHMVRQVMENRDWVLDQSDVKVQSIPFTKASRYTRPDWVTFYAFRSANDANDIAISDRRQNPPLPSDTKWTYFASFASPIKAAVGFDIMDTKTLRQEVQKLGFKRLQRRRVLRAAPYART